MRQRENFLVLMDNYGTALKYAETSLNSAGTAMQKFEIYQESIEAKTNKLRTAFELLATKTLNSGLIKGIVDLSTEILTLINNMGGLVPVLTSVGLIWLGWKTNLLPSIITQFKAIVLAQGGMITSSISASMAQLGLAGSIKAVGLAIKSVLLTNPAGWAILAVGAIASLVGIVDKLNNVAVEAKEKVNNLSSELSDLQNKSNNINDLSSRFFELKGIDKTNEQLEEYYDIQNQLKELIPDLNGSINEQGNFIIDEEVSVTSLSNAYKELLDDKRKALAEASKESIGYSIKEYENEKKKIEDLIKANELYKKSKKEALTDDEQFQLDLTQNTYNVPIGGIDKAIKDTSNSIKKYSQEINSSIRNIVFETEEWGKQTQEEKDSILQAFSEIEPDILSTYGNMLENGTLEVEKLLSAIKDTDSYQKAFNRTIEDGTGILDTYGNSLIDLSNSIKSLSSTRSEIESLTDVLNNLNDGNFSASDMEELLSISEEFLPYLNDEIALREKLNETITDYKETYKKEYYNIISTSEEYYNARIKGDTELHNTLSSNIEEFFNGLGIVYKDDFDNYTDLENAKLKLTSNIVKQLAGEWFNYFDSFGNIINEKLDPRFGSGATASYASGLAESALKIKNARDSLFKIIDDTVYEPIDINFDSKSAKGKDKHIEAFQKQYDELKYLRDKDLISAQQYYDGLKSLNDKYFAGNSKYIDQFRQYDLELYNLQKELAEKHIEDIINSYEKANKEIQRKLTQFDLQQQLVNDDSQEYIDIEQKKYDEIIKLETELQRAISELQAIGTAQAQEEAENLIDTYYDTVQQRYSIIANLQSTQISIYNEQIETLEKQKSALEDLHEFTMQMIKDELNAKKKSVQEEIKGIEEVFNRRKQALRDEQDTRNYEKGLTEKSSVVADLENQLALIKNDETAIAKRKKLEEELAKAKEDLADYQYKHSIDLAEKALDDQLKIEKDKLQKEVDLLDNTLSNEVKMRELADKRIEQSGKKLKDQLIKHAKEYGTFTVDEVTNAWDIAGKAVEDFDNKQKGLLITLNSIVDKLKEVQSNLSTVQNKNLDQYASSIGTSTSYNKSDADKHAQMVANSKAWLTASSEKKLELQAENQKLGKELGYTYDPQTGIWYKKNGVRAYHSGGVVGGLNYATKSTEELAKLLKGELVITPPQADKVMDMITNNSNSNINISMPIVIEGNADSDTVKSLEKQVGKIADTVIEKLKTARANSGFKNKPKFV